LVGDGLRRRFRGEVWAAAEASGGGAIGAAVEQGIVRARW
jgi:hypothetical protein